MPHEFAIVCAQISVTHRGSVFELFKQIFLSTTSVRFFEQVTFVIFENLIYTPVEVLLSHRLQPCIFSD